MVVGATGVNVPYVAGLLANRRAGLVIDHAAFCTDADEPGIVVDRGLADALDRVGRTLAVVAVVGGAPVRELAMSVMVPRVVYAGEFGAEWLGRTIGGREVLPPAAALRLALAGPLLALGFAGQRGVRVRRRGRCLLVLDSGSAGASWPVRGRVTAWARRLGLRVIERDDRVELRADDRSSNGGALARIVAHFRLQAVAYVGDEGADPGAFALLADLRRSGLVTVAISVRQAPDDRVAAHVDLRLTGRAAATVELTRLAEFLCPRGPVVA